MRTHIVVTCPRCGHEWAYMGRKIEAVMQGYSQRIRCKCGANIRLRKE